MYIMNDIFLGRRSTMSSGNFAVSGLQKNRRAESIASCRFYEAEKLDRKMKSFIETTRSVAQSESHLTKQSRNLPFWVWYIIAKCNGIPLKTNERPYLGTILHTLTFASALVYALSYVWRVAYDIASPKTQLDIPGGTVSIFLVFCWCAFGFYCKDLSSRLFHHPRFLKDVRMHSRTVFKINASLLVFLLGFLFTAINVIDSLSDKGNCETIDLDEIVCSILSISGILFSVFTLIWHSLVSFVFISVCRTHTIGLRRYIKEIEHDAAIFARYHSILYKNYPVNQDDVWQESLWLADIQEEEEDIAACDQSSYDTLHRHKMAVIKRDSSPVSPNVEKKDPSTAYGSLNSNEEISILFSPVVNNLEDQEEQPQSEDCEWEQIEREKPYVPFRRMKMIAANEGTSDGDSPITINAMTSAEIMHHYWTINSRLRFSSSALQRWFASFIALVLLRCSTYLVHWLRNEATPSDIIQFIVPLTLLIVLSTALAEVNVEGNRVLRCLYPTEERLNMLQFLALNPLQMSIYGFGMTHGTIVTVVFAILVGFVTRIIITEMTK